METIPNVNCLWGALTAGTLARLGLRYAVIAPGSRSAPLAWSLAREPGLEAISVLDERSAGFCALGLAKAAGVPVALVCTSGTAAANFFPAIIEASLSAVPLLVLTADRPPELRDCHAGQAIDQVKLYGHFPRWQHEVALPENQPELLRYLRQTLVHAWDRATHTWPGPVHLNFPFREPLAPTPETGFVAPEPKAWAALLGAHETEQNTGVVALGVSRSKVWRSVQAARTGLIVAGAAMPHQRLSPELVSNMVKFLRRRGWPVLADVLSPLRQAAGLRGQLVTHYDLILRDEKHLPALAPDVVIQIGPPPTSRKLRAWLQRLEIPTVILHDGLDNADPLHRNAVHWRGGPLALAMPNEKPRADFVRRWTQLEKKAALATSRRLGKLDWLFEGKAPWLLARLLPAKTPVFLASSMPVRYAEYFWTAGRGQEIFCNRGANGIDGTLSTALGIAWARRRPVVLYTGDLALLHDQNGFLAARALPAGASLTIVLANNDGGGIFEHLPMAKFDPPYEKYFATPQGVDFAKLAALHGLEYRRPGTWAEFAQAVRPLPRAGVRLIELRTDRKRDAAGGAELFRDLAAELAAARI
jgi:2-succinyl-5-enolpyruvyl-6-hydroxy-3-cyclohexene-1-carboxylate synthase